MKSIKIKNVYILIDNPNSWFLQYGKKLRFLIKKRKIKCTLVTNERDIKKNADVCFYLSCIKITKENTLNKFKFNIVVHGSDLPKGRGHSPWVWNIIDKKNKLTLSLFSIITKNKTPDSGPIYFKEKLNLNGSELLNEIREKIGQKIINMCLKFIIKINKMKFKEQKGKPTYCRKRKPLDQELSLKKSLFSQINILRTADNERWPAYFFFKKRKFILKIFK
jgi:methionyl-tRNA formyltransferase